MNKQSTDRTRNERQKRRRENERRWLIQHGFTSWESLHTKLMKGEVTIKSSKKEANKV